MRSLPSEQGGNILAIALSAYAGEINEQQAIASQQDFRDTSLSR
ncbi:hypothetical protein [aff. Roholtiella sp. LEGE 12411]|nr:hypothetical protein [aff. Roholtiella sp. LEGE 12411]